MYPLLRCILYIYMHATLMPKKLKYKNSTQAINLRLILTLSTSSVSFRIYLFA